MSDTAPTLLASREALAEAHCPCEHPVTNHTKARCIAPWCPCSLSWADALLASGVVQEPAAALADAREEGVRQAITWLRADYPYGEGPEWRENGAEWIADRLADETRQLREAGLR